MTTTPGLSVRNGGSSRFFFDDRMGTATKETDALQSVTATRTYDAFGNFVASSDSSPRRATPPQNPCPRRRGSEGRVLVPSGAGGQGDDGGCYHEDATGLKLLGHRYYDPATGRFLTRDPIRDGSNWYSYCSNNPLKWVDPAGLAAGDKYKTEEDAALAAMEECAAMTAKTGKEAGTQIIFSKEGGFYYYLRLKEGTKGNWSPGFVFPQTIALVHSHSRTWDGSSEGFSPQDRRTADTNGVTVYLVTPKGKRKRYKPDKNKKGKGVEETYNDQKKVWKRR